MLQPVLLSHVLSSLPVPLLGRLVPAGFPSPADDYLEGEIDLAAFLIERPASTFLMRVSGHSMNGAGSGACVSPFYGLPISGRLPGSQAQASP